MQTRWIFAALVSVAALVSAGAPASRAGEFRPYMPNPPECGQATASARGAVWSVHFWAPDDLYLRDGCFRTEAECKAWLYQAQSTFEHNIFRPCRKEQ